MEIAEEKKALRREVRMAERALPLEEKLCSDERILTRLRTLSEYQNADTVFCFVGTPHEIDTRPILLDVLSSGRRLCVPRCLAGGRMEPVVIRSLNDLSPGAYDILEPVASCQVLQSSEVDFTVVPCLSCDRSGRRLGRGGGYYDRFLADYRGQAAMVCRESLMRRRIPADLYDQTIEILVTDAQIYHCRTDEI
ncbi:5-formyltetrahydrofolate cyclo-ligase [Oscillibacter sp. MSJ-2]|uniref:5-formyltetrahydrofolate cyclo-ligase n=1 Tax=Dysosmobacter acutus TaxID=2841504 RepID=A0ABS6FBK5_9FIRM|nr:5-formyltetrahydrofolate cyclo-ligase [Dysosmobacter acutus]MBU5627662.1 5-formyltetrahydrofolate cyclo-ligase [Dysosmobacter acutus]